MLETSQASTSSLWKKPEYTHRLQGKVLFVVCDRCYQITSNGSQEVVALKSTHEEVDGRKFLHYGNTDIGCRRVRDQSWHGNLMGVFYWFQLVQQVINTHNTIKIVNINH